MATAFPLAILALVSAPLLTFAGPVGASGRVVAACTVIVEADSGAVVRRDGACNQRQAPQSTFKIPLAIMGFETRVLIGPADPKWTWNGAWDAPLRDRKQVDPAIWERDSVLWFSRELVKRMAAREGGDVLQRWVDRLDYGNRDARGDAGAGDGLTHSWLSSSLRISPDEQVRFLRRLLKDDLPASGEAMAMTRAIVPTFKTVGGWAVQGKTGTASREVTPEGEETRGWFVGWAEKDGRRLVFAVFEHAVGSPDGEFAGPRLRERLLAGFDGLARPAAP